MTVSVPPTGPDEITPAVALARDLVRIDTTNPPGREQECIALLAERLEGGPFDVTVHSFGPGRASLIARASGRDNGPPLCFTGHVDVVPTGVKPWSFDPFSGRICDGRLWGRGACDMKGGVAAFVTAALELDEGPRERGLLLVITGGEETACEGAAALAEEGLLGPAAGLVVAEPTSNYPLLSHKGSMRLRVKATGKTAHSSMPDAGDNAVLKIVRAVSAVEAIRFDAPAHPVLGETTLCVTTIAGGRNLNSVPDAAEFTIDLRIIPNHDHAEILENIRSAVGEDLTVEVVNDVMGVDSDLDDPMVARIVGAYRSKGVVIEKRGAPYFTDGSVLQPAFNGVPTVIVGPGDMRMAHQTDEYCSLAEIEAARATYLEIMRDWCMARTK